MRRHPNLWLLALSATTLTSVPSCSDPTPPTPRGAVYGVFNNGSGGLCPATSPTATIQVGTVTESQKNPVFDGEGAMVSCNVNPSGTGFSFAGSLRQNTTTVTFENVLVGSGQPNTGTVFVSTASTAGTYRPATGATCDFQLIGVDQGRIWSKFECANMILPGTTSAKCAIYNGVVVFENCE